MVRWLVGVKLYIDSCHDRWLEAARPPAARKLAKSRPKVDPKLATSRPKVGPESAQSRPKVGPRLVQDRPKPQPKVVQGRPQSKIGPSLSPGPILVDQSSGPVQKHQIWPEMGRESTVWPETWSRSMPGPFRSLWDGSNPLQWAVPGLILEVQVGSTMSVRAQIIENGPNRVQNRPFGPKQRPNESYGLSGPIRTTPEAKNGQQK